MERDDKVHELDLHGKKLKVLSDLSKVLEKSSTNKAVFTNDEIYSFLNSCISAETSPSVGCFL